jgi:hypothetical protein
MTASALAHTLTRLLIQPARAGALRIIDAQIDNAAAECDNESQGSRDVGAGPVECAASDRSARPPVGHAVAEKTQRG